MSDSSVPISVPPVSLQLYLPVYMRVCFVLGLTLFTVAKVRQKSYTFNIPSTKASFSSLNFVLHLRLYCASNDLGYIWGHFLRDAFSKYY